jgi:hypothetical protein
MSTENLKKELHTLIDNTEDEEILSIVKEELVAYQTGEKKFDDLSDLSPDDRAELEELANEDPMTDTISYEEHKKEMKEWLSKL